MPCMQATGRGLLEDSEAMHAALPLLQPLLRDDLTRWPSDADRSVQLADTDAVFSELPPYARARFFYTNGTLWKANARCVYRRDEVTAWSLLQLLEREADMPDFDIVFNCRDGPLLRRPRGGHGRGIGNGVPMVFAYSTTANHAEVAFPDYTLWGLPGKIKPWPQLRLDLLYRAQVPFSRRAPRAIATGVINDYHNSLGVKARQAVQRCAADANGAGDKRLEVRYHRLYFNRYYSTEEHCKYKYILLSPGSHAVWLDHMKQKLLCGSLVMLLEPEHLLLTGGQPTQRAGHQHAPNFQFDVLTRLLVPGKHYLSLPLPPLDEPPTRAERKRGKAYEARRQARMEQSVCEAITAGLDWADANPEQAQTIARAGRALVRDVLTMDAVYTHMGTAIRRAARLLNYSPSEAMAAHRMVRGKAGRLEPFNATNMTRVPSDPEAFIRTLRDDNATYPVTAQINASDWRAVVMDYNFSRMGVAFAESARALEAMVLQMRAQQQEHDEEQRKADRRAKQRDKAFQRAARKAAKGRGRSQY